MTDAPDAVLLEQFGKNGSEEAFTEIVRRHLGLVHSVALRCTQNAQHAEEITQAVFIILARKAPSLGRKTILSGWLYHTARLTAANFQRAESRRVRREHEVFMQSPKQAEPVDSAWLELGPLLEEAMAKLGTTDRDAIVLRFFENKSLREVGTAMGLEERAAQKRVARGLEKLRAVFTKRGVVLSAAVIAGAVSAHSVQAAPVGLFATVSAAAVKGTAVTASTLTLVKGVLKVMAWTKAKLAMAMGGAVVLAAGTATVATIALSSPFDPWQHLDSFSAEHGAMITKNMSPNGPPSDESIKQQQKETDDHFGRFFRKAPAGIVIRPTHSPTNSAFATSGDLIIERDVPFKVILATAYATDNYVPPRTTRMIVPEDTPAGYFDFLVNVPDHGLEKLQDQIKTQFGLAGRIETITTNVLALRLKNPEAPGLKPNARLSFVGQAFFSVSDLARHLETFILHQPVLDETKLDQLDKNGLRRTHFFAVPFKPTDPASVEKLLLDEFGLEFVPTNAPIEVLVVEQMKN